eukprot:TRINITY_DN50145_c0_g1_i1.p2 TRINITY_DN50145_c0_g1~~TRINITY_DN50145_c0_g1_i1.p2  ORF type:complete len:168 (-),score=4.88 TRINITY_DN50145_c0_g1_i1:312-815(-)
MAVRLGLVASKFNASKNAHENCRKLTEFFSSGGVLYYVCVISPQEQWQNFATIFAMHISLYIFVCSTKFCINFSNACIQTYIFLYVTRNFYQILFCYLFFVILCSQPIGRKIVRKNYYFLRLNFLRAWKTTKIVKLRVPYLTAQSQSQNFCYLNKNQRINKLLKRGV